jgi:hypothetical protein
MKLFYRLSLIGFLILLSKQQLKAVMISGDTVLYKQVVDSLIKVALKNKHSKPVVIISKSE